VHFGKIAIFAALLLAACTGRDSFAGKWQSDGETLLLSDDGKVRMDTSGGSASGTWRSDGSGGIAVSVNVRGRIVTISMRLTGGKLVSSYNGVSGTFTRAQ